MCLSGPRQLTFTFIGDTIILATSRHQENPLSLDMAIGRASIGDRCVLKNCEVNDGARVGDDCKIGDGAIIGGHAVLDKGTVIPPGKHVAPKTHWSGNPAVFKGPVEDDH